MTEIRFTGVGHRFGERTVLAGVDLVLTERRIGVVGGNGSGKSTLARMINGLVLPSTGTVTVDGLSTARKGRDVRRRVGFVFTDPDNQIVMPTVAEDVAFSLRRHRLPDPEVRRRVTEVLDRFDLAGHADHPAHQLSGGQKQLLALAAVLVTDPDVLVADEPTTLLDARNARRVAALLAELPQQVVLVTHHLHLLSGFDRVVVVDGGRVVADADPATALAAYDRVLADPAGPAIP
ncbi:energy-coupling factor ABC transporter ATP-binding protein [Nakamurella endophytica]|uniref:Cobalt ABC transporter ATP-binding protein n=1 Tax=Nakamurella endophytica TaxID=1748367 RepID=A0A917SLM3_9ACTN|nr:ABC transporter ATP-binding protein [Nakamurella endophytica]GGL88263.1 cobalt ABC transporter ATP-binding protein [Nakamurella endophytica]